jgi:CobQ-like glutamine amidotransferase family enzyme
MNNQKIFTIVHFYPKEMNIYGDMGNILTLETRMQKRGYGVKTIDVGPGKLDLQNLPYGDIYFMGGGQDDDMYKVFEDLSKNKKQFVQDEAEKGKVFLLICGAFKLFGKYFLDSSGRQMDGLNMIPVSTRAPSDKIKDRCVGNVISELSLHILEEMKERNIEIVSKYLVGFENHSGQTYIEDGRIKAVGNVIYGKGNNSREKFEGARIKNIFGSYLHGSLLPKNPHFTDLLLSLALGTYEIPPLEDEIEWQAHNAILNRFLK